MYGLHASILEDSSEIYAYACVHLCIHMYKMDMRRHVLYMRFSEGSPLL